MTAWLSRLFAAPTLADEDENLTARLLSILPMAGLTMVLISAVVTTLLFPGYLPGLAGRNGPTAPRPGPLVIGHLYLWILEHHHRALAPLWRHARAHL